MNLPWVSRGFGSRPWRRGVPINCAGLLSLLLLLIHLPAAAQTYSKPLGIALEGFEYPHEVKYFSLDLEGETTRMAYMDVNKAGEKAVLLLHGKNFFGEYWAGTIRELTNAGFRVIVPDQVGFGKSAKPDITYSFDLLAANTARLLDELKVEKVAVAGHSMGGMLAVRFARNHPARVTHVVLENPIGLEDYRFKVPPSSLEEAFKRELNDTDSSKIRQFVQRYFVNWKPEVAERYVEVRSRVALSGEYPRWAKASARTFLMIYQQPVRHEFKLVNAPTLLVIGQEDRTTLGRGQVSEEVLKTLGQYPQLGKEAAGDFPNATLIELPGVGHIPHLETPERFHDVLLKFLRNELK